MKNSWDKMVESFLGLPGVGPKMAERLALFLLRHPEQTERFVHSIEEARRLLQRCSLCGDFVESDEPRVICERCQDPRRDQNILCVVEDIADLQALERSRVFRGRYHVLGGVLSALDGIGPEQLRIGPLLERIKTEGVREVILATNPTVEGETTASYLADLLKPQNVLVTRLAYGLPSGSTIQYADEFTLAKAVEGRRAFA